MDDKNTFNRKPLVAAVATACAAMAGPAPAQDAGEAQIEEILVTATRRATSVTDIPYNISAMTGDSLDTLQAVTQYDVLRAMYGITVVDRGYRNGGMVNSIVIRGLNVDNGQNGDIMLNAVPTVATYYDNSPMYANFLVKDVERVEVLRGPQGTLYGSGSLGGTVRYITRTPSTEGFESDIELDYGQTAGSDGNNLAADVMVNVPMGDIAALRVNYSHIDNDGSIDYVNAYQLNEFREPLVNVNGDCVDPRAATDQQLLFNTGCFEEVKDADTVEIDYVRAAVRVEPSDNFWGQLTYHYQDDTIGARRSTTLGNNNQPTDSPLYFEYGDDDSGQVILEPSEREASLAALDLEWDMGFATFTSTTSVYDHEGVGESDNGGLWASGGQVDPDNSNDWNFLFYGGAWPRPIQRAERGYTDEVLTQEFRLVSNTGDSKFDWIVGAFYMDQDTNVYQLSHNPGMNLFKNACRNTGDPVCTTGGLYGGFWPRFYEGDLSEIDFEYRRDTRQLPHHRRLPLVRQRDRQRHDPRLPAAAGLDLARRAAVDGPGRRRAGEAEHLVEFQRQQHGVLHLLGRLPPRRRPGRAQPRQRRPVRRAQRRRYPQLRVRLGAELRARHQGRLRALPVHGERVLRRLAGPAAQHHLGVLRLLPCRERRPGDDEGHRARSRRLRRRQLPLPRRLHLRQRRAGEGLHQPADGWRRGAGRFDPAGRTGERAQPESRQHLAGGLGHGPYRRRGRLLPERVGKLHQPGVPGQ
jgi:hypothetical protein